MQNGVAVWEAAGFLGMSPEMVERTYGHHHPDHLKGAAKGFRAARRPAQSVEITVEMQKEEKAKSLKELVGPPGLEPGTRPL